MPTHARGAPGDVAAPDASIERIREVGRGRADHQERRSKMAQQATRFGSLERYEKGGVEVINDNAKNYVFSNVFQVASGAKPYEKIAVGRNIEYVIEAIRAEGTSGWRAAAHDEFARVMDGEVEVRLLKLDDPSTVPPDTQGSVALAGTPKGKKMGVVKARRGHMTLLPAGAAYQFHAARPGVVLLQTLIGRDTVERWADICQTTPRPQAPRG